MGPVPSRPIASSADSLAVGPYRTLRELGRGGQAIVYLADDTRIQRQVALKVLGNLGPASEQVIKRFRREAEAAASLDHPNICAVFEADVDRGVPYIAMRYVPGQTLAQRNAAAREAGVGPPTRAELLELAAVFEKAARALHAAHTAGVIHRDIKPGNLMLTPEGEPVLLDFGLARHDDGSQQAQALSVSGDVSGTPAYMSPEQMTGNAAPDRRTDVYSLGASLYESATLRHPFEAATRESLYHAILNQEPPDPRRLNPAIERDLAVILETALAKPRDRRYQTALDLAEDLRRFRSQEPILARPASRLERAGRWAQRNRALAASLVVAVGLLVLASGLLSYGIGASGKAQVEASLRKLADAARDRAEAERAKLDQLDRDRRVLTRLEDLLMQSGALLYGLDLEREAKALGPHMAAALRDFGIDLRRPGAVQPAVAALSSLQQRNPAAWSAVCDALSYLPWNYEADDSEAARLVRTQSEALLAALPGAAWPELDKALVAWEKDKVDGFGPLLNEDLERRTSSQLAALAGALHTVPERGAAALALLDKALKRDPGNFQLHFMRGGLGLMQAFPLWGQDEARFKKLIAVVEHHYRVAVALRPRSGFFRSMLASALALSGSYAEAGECVEESTRLEPQNAILWLLKARYYSHTPFPERGIEACKQALALDPDLTGGRELLLELGKPRKQK